MIKPPFNRQGNKYPIIDKLLRYIPPHDIYVEPFLGSGALFFNKIKAKQNILNDLDKYTLDGIKLLKLGSPNPQDYERDFSSIEKLKRLYNSRPQTIEDEILKHKLISKGSFNGREIKKAEDIYILTNPSSTFKNIAFYQNKLNNVVLLNRDYSFVIKKYDSMKTFFFLDPPYEKTDKTFGYAQDTDFNYENFYDVVSKIKGFFLISINDSPYIRNLFKDFNIVKINVPSKWSNAKVKNRKELLIMNYKI